jgi:hypothetical protein
MRYTGSKAKRCRATGANLYGNEKFDGLRNIVVFESIPLSEHIDQLFQEHLLVEFYSR